MEEQQAAFKLENGIYVPDVKILAEDHEIVSTYNMQEERLNSLMERDSKAKGEIYHKEHPFKPRGVK